MLNSMGCMRCIIGCMWHQCLYRKSLANFLICRHVCLETAAADLISYVLGSLSSSVLFLGCLFVTGGGQLPATVAAGRACSSLWYSQHLLSLPC
jgi:hypothetical protein